MFSMARKAIVISSGEQRVLIYCAVAIPMDSEPA